MHFQRKTDSEVGYVKGMNNPPLPKPDTEKKKIIQQSAQVTYLSAARTDNLDAPHALNRLVELTFYITVFHYLHVVPLNLSVMG